MKITCESCQAKYTIADDKVVGKTVKIKCKKCGSAIVVQGDAVHPAALPPLDGDDGAETRVFAENHAHAAAPTSAGEWLVNVAEGDERSLNVDQIVAEYARGTINHETYVWKDGMTEWIPLSSVPDLMRAVVSEAPAPAQDPLGLMGTVVMDSASQASAGLGAQAAAAPPSGAGAAAPAAARRAGARGGVDVFGAREQAETRGQVAPSAPPPGGDRMTGARNENSVLFSLSALTAAETAVKAQEEKGVLDMRPGPMAVGGSRPPPARNGGARAGLDDIMNLGGGGIGSPMLAPPPVLAPVVEAPPPPPQHIPSVAPPMGMAPGVSPYGIPDMPQKKKPVGLIVGAVGALVVVGGVAAAALGVFSSPPQPVATNDAPQPSAQADTKPAEPPPTEAKTAEPTPAEVKTAEPAPTDDHKAGEPAAVAAGNQAGTVRGTQGSAATTSKTPEKEEKKEEKKVEAAPEKTAAPAAAADGAEFNRGAATSALGSAAGAAKSCKKPDGPTGTGKVKVTFAPSGNVTSAQVQGAPYAGTPVGGCVAATFRAARVPPFSGAPVSVTKSFTIN
ncbi:zinc-ribbon domain-containing protein [Chondromyces crocatus]|uniref:GYF domain-containing protein n=1 Tax=Chondromyces crocatus TaxID=52 RepID=A0A0K1E6U1_CHOCO|nr:zinc-ribbon domain-containing protein [Chondromyces crocatus]AKT36559.1 uncharacterized protein CMC5_006770 [Chondromyces crocatus]